MDPIEAKKRKMEQQAARRKAKLESGDTTASGDSTGQDVSNAAAPASTAPPTPTTPSPATPSTPTQPATPATERPHLVAPPSQPASTPPASTTPAASKQPDADQGEPSEPVAPIGPLLMVLGMVVIGLVVASFFPDRPEDPPNDGDPNAPTVSEDPADPDGGTPSAVDSAATAPADSEAPAQPTDPVAEQPTDPDPVSEQPTDPVVLDRPLGERKSGLETLTVALEETFDDDPELASKRKAVDDAIAQLEVQGRALTALEQQWIKRARRALADTGGAPTVDPDPVDPVDPDPVDPDPVDPPVDPDPPTQPDADPPVHQPPTGVAAVSSAPGAIQVSWERTPTERCVITDYRVERQASGSDAWDEVATVAAVESCLYVDTQVQERVAYLYRVTSVATVDSGSGSLPAEYVRQSSEAAGPVQAARALYVVPVTVEVGVSAFIRVYGWDSVEGEFDSKCFQVKLGESIGEAIRRKGHELNLATGAELVSSAEGERKHPTKPDLMQPFKSITVKWPDGTEETVTDHDVPEAVKGK